MNIRLFLATFSVSAILTLGAAERNIPAGYYNALDGKSGAALKAAAHSAIRNHKTINYGDETWDVFKDSDVRPDGTWWDIYSNEKRKAKDGHGGMNIEHAVANSWWGKTKNDAYKDIHHLFPSDAEANNRKSNYPLGEISGSAHYTNGVTTIGQPASGSKGGTGNWVYEPADQYKGDNARAYFYMAVCYPDISWKDSDSGYKNWIQFNKEDYPTLVAYAQTLLLRWADNDPVSDKEIDRNEAIYKHQKNRNPFVDLPGLEDYIWGDKKNVAFDLNAALTGHSSSINSIEEAIPFGVEPFNGGLTITCGDTIARVIIVNMSGRIIVDLSNVTDGTTVSLAPGLYIISAGSSSRPVKVLIP